MNKTTSLRARPRLRVAQQDAIGAIALLALSADERHLLTSTEDGALRLWSLDQGREIALLEAGEPLQAVALAGSEALVVAATVRGELFLWRPAGKRLALGQLGSPIMALGMTPDGALLAALTERGEAWLYSTSDNSLLGRLSLPGSPFSCATMDERLFVATAHGSRIAVHDLQHGGVIRFEAVVDGDVARLSLRGNTLIADLKDERVAGMDLATGERWSLVGNEAETSALAQAEELDRVVMGSADGGLWSALGRKGEFQALNSEEPVHALAVDRRGDYFLAASRDGMTTLWSVAAGEQLATLVSTRAGWAVVDASGRFDGNQQGLSALSWEDDAGGLGVEQLGDDRYSPVLLSRVVRTRHLETSTAFLARSLDAAPRVELKLETRLPSGEARVRVTVERQDTQGIGGVRLYRNGKLLQQFADAPAKGPLARTVSVPLSADGATLEAIAWSEDGLQSLPARLVVGRGGRKTGGEMHVLAVGIDAYPLPGLRLEHAVADARGFAQALENGKLWAADARLLLDGEATRAGILNALESMARSKPDSAVVVYLAGHGVDVGDEWHFIPADIPAITEQDIRNGGISSAEFERLLTAIPADQMLLVIDSCLSGGVLPPIERFKGLKSLRRLARTVGVHIVTSTGKDQNAAEVESLGHGLFTYALLQGLSGQADREPNDGRIGVDELFSYVREAVPAISRTFLGEAQYPMTYSSGAPLDLVMFSGLVKPFVSP